MNEHDFNWQDLDGRDGVWTGRVPQHVALNAVEFEQCWALHPDDFNVIMMHGRPVRTPRWQQAYGSDYAFSGQISAALPVPPLLQRLLDWSTEAIDPHLNGILLNWYDGGLGHYIGAHRDSTKNMVPGTPIVTISFGEQRTFRLRPWHGTGLRDFEVTDGSVLVMPFATNLSWTHEVTRSARRRRRRISVTLRGFAS